MTAIPGNRPRPSFSCKPPAVSYYSPVLLRPVYWLLRWLLALALLGFAVAALRASLGAFFAPETAEARWSALFAGAGLWAAVAGFALRVILSRLGRRGDGDPVEFLDTLEHELTHAVAGTLTFAPPVSLTATLRGGGEVELRRSNPLAALAPYCLPLFAAALAALTLLFRDEWAGYGRLAVAFLLGSFAYRLLREFHFGQTDFRAFGLAFSMVFIAAALPLCLLAVLDLAGLAYAPWREAGRLFLEQGRFVGEALVNGTTEH